MINLCSSGSINEHSSRKWKEETQTRKPFLIEFSIDLASFCSQLSVLRLFWPIVCIIIYNDKVPSSAWRDRSTYKLSFSQARLRQSYLQALLCCLLCSSELRVRRRRILRLPLRRWKNAPETVKVKDTLDAIGEMREVFINQVDIIKK